MKQDIDDGALSMQLPLLTIQPLLENAVEHGIAPAGGGEIELSCRMVEDVLQLSVSNSGRPLNAQSRARIALALSGDTQGGHHLGLANIASRLRLIYGGEAEIPAGQDDQKRTQIRLRIPAQTGLVQEEKERAQNHTTNNISVQ